MLSKFKLFLAKFEYPRPFWFILFGWLLNGVAYFVAQYLEVSMASRGFSVEQSNFPLVINGAGKVLGGVCGGMLSDRVGRKKVMVLSMVVVVITTTLVGMLQFYPLILLTAFLQGMFGSMNVAAVNAATADYFPTKVKRGIKREKAKKKRKTALGLVNWFFNGGCTVSTFLAMFFLWIEPGQYYLFFVADSATTLILLILVMKGVPDLRPSPVTVRVPKGDKAGLKGVLRNVPFQAFLLLAFIETFLYSLSSSALPTDIGNRHIVFGLSLYNSVLFVNAVLVLGLGWKNPPLKPYHALVLSAILLGVGFGLPGFVGLAWWSYIIGSICWTVAELLVFRAILQIAAEYADRDKGGYGLYMGLADLPLALARMLAPLAGPWVFIHYGPVFLWVGCLGLALVPAVGFYLFMRPAILSRASAVNIVLFVVVATTGLVLEPVSPLLSWVGCLGLVLALAVGFLFVRSGGDAQFWRRLPLSRESTARAGAALSIIALMMTVGSDGGSHVVPNTIATPTPAPLPGQQVVCNSSASVVTLRLANRNIACFHFTAAGQAAFRLPKGILFDTLCVSVEPFAVRASYEAVTDDARIQGELSLYAPQNECSTVGDVGLMGASAAMPLSDLETVPVDNDGSGTGAWVKNSGDLVHEVDPSKCSGLEGPDFFSFLDAIRQTCIANAGRIQLAPNIVARALCGGKNRGDAFFRKRGSWMGVQIFDWEKRGECVSLDRLFPGVRTNGYLFDRANIYPLKQVRPLKLPAEISLAA